MSEATAEKQTATLARVIHTIEKEILLKSDQTINNTQQDSKLDKAVLTLENKIDSECKKLENSIKNELNIIKIEQITIKSEINLLKWMLGLVIAGVMSLLLKQFF